VGLIFSLMILLTGALVGLESLGVLYQVFKLALPLTWGISMMRVLLAGSEVFGLGLHSLVYLGMGLMVFAMGYRRARTKGTLMHYSGCPIM
jgi:hypothetical protein